MAHAGCCVASESSACICGGGSAACCSKMALGGIILSPARLQHLFSCHRLLMRNETPSVWRLLLKRPERSGALMPAKNYKRKRKCRPSPQQPWQSAGKLALAIFRRRIRSWLDKCLAYGWRIIRGNGVGCRISQKAGGKINREAAAAVSCVEGKLAVMVKAKA
jgi:hypothetical protein